MKLFNFPCFAAMAVEMESDGEPGIPDNIGVWLTEREAVLSAIAYEVDRVKRHGASQDAFWAPYGGWRPPNSREPSVVKYTIIPLKNVTVDFGQLEDYLEKAAIMRLAGVGVA